jgi:hypothetical protein
MFSYTLSFLSSRNANDEVSHSMQNNRQNYSSITFRATRGQNRTLKTSQNASSKNTMKRKIYVPLSCTLFILNILRRDV